MPIYSDLNHQTPTIDPLVVDVAAIKQSLLNILNTKKGERVFLPEFGSAIDEILFQEMNEDTELILFTEIVETIQRWEDRVRLRINKSTITANYAQNRYDVNLVFDVVGLSDQQFEFQGSLERE